MKANKRVKSATNKCGKRIKIARVERDMTQLNLAVAMETDFGIKISSTGVLDMEKGRRFVKDFEIMALADILGKHPMWLLYGDKVPKRYQ